MIPVFQTKTLENDGESDWRAACYASILERTIRDTLPISTLAESTRSDDQAALAAQGYVIRRTSVNDGTPQGYAVLRGVCVNPGPRGEMMIHGVVTFDGTPVHDPYPIPNTVAIGEYVAYEQILPVAEARTQVRVTTT